MSSKIESIDEIKGGKLFLLNREKFSQAVSVAPDGKYFHLLELIRPKMSDKQRCANWGIAERIIRNCLIEAYGEYVSKEDAHEFCMKHCLPKEYKDFLKQEWKSKKRSFRANKKQFALPFRLTTTKLTTVWAMEYYINMQVFALEWFNATIPDPDPNYKNHDIAQKFQQHKET
jgi:hypothetical protein